jgi:AraC-like DNA-binding protein
MRLFIKNMVCCRCKIAVKSELEKLGLHPIYIELGKIAFRLNYKSVAHLSKQFKKATGLTATYF